MTGKKEQDRRSYHKEFFTIILLFAAHIGAAFYWGGQTDAALSRLVESDKRQWVEINSSKSMQHALDGKITGIEIKTRYIADQVGKIAEEVSK